MKNSLQFVVACACLLASCGGGGATGGGTQSSSPIITSISVSPAIAYVQVGKTQQFTASVQGTGPFNKAVSWLVNSTPGGNATLGTISSIGLYTAPQAVPATGSVTIHATSTQDTQISGTAKGDVWLDISSVAVSPAIGNVAPGGTLQFTATVRGTGSFNTAVNWAVRNVSGGDATFGTITSTGLYTAPAGPGGTLTPVEATSVADAQISGSAQANVASGPPRPQILSLSPATANAGDQVIVNGTNLFAPGDSGTVVFSGPNEIPLPVEINIDSASETQLQVNVPLATVSGPVYVQIQQFNFPTQTSNSLAFTRLPRVHIRAPQKDLSQGESTTFQSRIFSGSGSESLTWAAAAGSVTSSGVYTAPASVLSDSFAVVTACITGTQTCDQERLGLHPFRIAPVAPVIALGGNVQLQAVQGGGFVTPSWQLNGPGNLQQDGTYTASTLPADGGGIPITATYGGVQEQVSVAVTGGFNGLVNRISDYIDMQQGSPIPPGTWVLDAGVIGNKLYVVAANPWYLSPSAQYFVDVYDLTDPVHPVWVDAFEPVAQGHFLNCGNYTYEFAGRDFSMGPPYAGVIAVYDTSGVSPILLSKQISTTTNAFQVSQDGCVFTVISENDLQQVPVVVELFNLENGGVIHSQYAPDPGLSGGNFGGAASDGNRMYVITSDAVEVYDLTVQPPSQIGSLQGGLGLETEPSIVGGLLFVPQEGGGKIESMVYDITDPQPSLLQSLSAGSVLSSSGAQVLTGSNDAGTQLVNISNPQQPTVTGTLFDFIDPFYAATLTGTHVYQSEGYGGLAIYDVSTNGGLPQSYLDISSGSGSVGSGPAYAQASNSSTLFFAIPYPVGEGPSGILSFDLSTQPASYLGSFSTGTSAAQSLALSNNDLYIGTTDSLRVLDVTNPSSPTQIGSVNLGIQSLAVSGNSLFAGTLDEGLVVFDVTQPSSPVQEASLSLPDLAYQMIVSGSLLLVADVSGGLLVYNITTPSSPQLLSEVKPSMGVFDVAMDGTLALLAAWDAGLVIVDLTNPSQPQVVGQAALGTDQPYSTSPVLLNKAFTVAALDKIAYIGVLNFDTNAFANNGEETIYGFDYTTPSLPRLVQLDSLQNEYLNDGILTLRAVGTALIASTTDGTGSGALFVELDASQPRNAINLLFLPSSLAQPPILGQLPAGSIQHRERSNAVLRRKFK